ncbi:MAG: ABC transporter permease, partial [Mycobacterium sp.]
MFNFVLGRVGRAIVTLFLVLVATFAMTRVAYRNPAATLLPRNATGQQVEAIKNALHLNESWLQQFWHYAFRGPAIADVPTGLARWPPSLGYSFHQQTAVMPLILSKISATASLALGAVVIWMVLSVAFGVLAARRPGSWTDRTLSGFSYFGLAIPTFVTGVLLSYFLFFKLSQVGVHLFPNGGYVPLTKDPLEWARHLVLPWATLVIAEVGVFQRVVRASMLETLGADYIRTARAKGISERRVYFDHALRTALTPVITLGGLELAYILGGGVVVESIFGIDGVGRLALTSALNGDFPVVLGATLFASLVFIVSTLGVDVINRLRDP